MAEALTLDEIWQRIEAQTGEFFKTHQGRWFTDRIEGDTLLPSQTDVRIPRSDFELVVPMLPLADPRKIAKFVTDYVHVAAVISDKRISKGQW